MKIIIDDNYEELAAEWQYQMIKLLKNALIKNQIDIDKAKEICGDFAFDLAMLQDQGELKVEGKQYRPVIRFDNFEGELFYNSDEMVQLHDYAFGNTAEAFEDNKINPKDK